MAVIDALASLEDVRPVHLPAVLDDPLYDFIDPEALDALVTDKEAISVSFTVADYDVQIDGDKLRIHYE
ncbi:HalOD1 output domain-containing protein [Natronococcus sp.]|uniref:HalOD1 output domain-containing protein n=1 Tax=Natronococcus sp. TaxID=35747 RepID=UPI0025E86309|nr:HalOD1 output domain-containing protein [Natronococcus sp.]